MISTLPLRVQVPGPRPRRRAHWWAMATADGTPAPDPHEAAVLIEGVVRGLAAFAHEGGSAVLPGGVAAPAARRELGVDDGEVVLFALGSDRVAADALPTVIVEITEPVPKELAVPEFASTFTLTVPALIVVAPV